MVSSTLEPLSSGFFVKAKFSTIERESPLLRGTLALNSRGWSSLNGILVRGLPLLRGSSVHELSGSIRGLEIYQALLW